MSEIDWMGRWYDIMRERGDNDSPSFAKYNLKTKEIEWFHFSHSKMDGVGVLVHLYQKRGIAFKKFPDLREDHYPTFFEALKIIYQALQFKKYKTVWNENRFDLKPDDVHYLSFKIFDPDQTLKIEDYCKKNKISESALFLNTISKVVLSTLSKNGEGTWTMPVNLRPVLKRHDYTSNHSSGVLINYKIDQSFKATHEMIKLKLKNKEHWAVWWIHQIGRIIGYKGMRFISNKNAKKTFMIGSFSNLGAWDLPPDEIYIGGPPGSKNFPVSIMLMKANGHISFSIKIHPFIMPNKEKVHEICENIAQSVINQVAHT